MAVRVKFVGPTQTTMRSWITTLLCATSGLLFAQPTDQQIVKDIKQPTDLKVELSYSTTKKVWSDAHAQWFWERAASVWRPADIAEYPNAKVVVYGMARYHTGTPPSFREFKVSSNEYDGIPAPTNDEILAHARKHLKDFVGEYRFNRMVALKSVRVADDPRTQWHTPLSFSMQFEVVADVIISDVETATETTRQETRFYREGVGQPWRSFMVTVERDVRYDNKQTHAPDEVRAMPTIGSRQLEEQAQADRAALGEVTIPDMPRDVDVFLYTHKMLREATPQQFKAYLLHMLAPSLFAEGSTTRLNANGEELVERVMAAAFNKRSPYAVQYCADPGVKHQQPGSMEWWNGTQDKSTRMVVMKAGGAWKNGQRVDGAWKITELGLGMWTDADNVARIASYEPGVLCKGSTASGQATQQGGNKDLLNKGQGLLNKIKGP